MEKLIRYRGTQKLTLDKFIDDILKNPLCKYCSSHDECQEMMGVTSIEEEIGEIGCGAFDNTIENLTNFYLKDCSTVAAK